MDNPAPILRYNPSAIVNIFNNAISPDATRRLLIVKGVYNTGRGGNYNGFYYDILKDESTDGAITLVVPERIRNNLVNGLSIECEAFITKKIQLNAGKIELQVNITTVLSQHESKYSDEQIQSFTIIQKKAEAGYRDVDGYIKKRIVQQRPVTITVLMGKTGIIDSDIKSQLNESLAFFELKFVRINLTSGQDILQSIKEHDGTTDILAISRGGMENMEVFNKPLLANATITLKSLFVTALGHTVDRSLMQQVADKYFDTPTAFGHFLNEIFRRTIDDLQNSKVSLVETVRMQMQEEFNRQKRSSLIITILLTVVALAVGLSFGKGCN